MAKDKQKTISEIKALNVPGLVIDETATAESLEGLLAVLNAAAASTKLEKDLEDAKTKNDEHEASILELNGALAKAEVNAKANPSKKQAFELGGKTYRINSGCSLPDGEGGTTVFTPEQIASDVKLQKKLIEMKSGVIRQL